MRLLLCQRRHARAGLRYRSRKNKKYLANGEDDCSACTDDDLFSVWQTRSLDLMFKTSKTIREQLLNRRDSRKINCERRQVGQSKTIVAQSFGTASPPDVFSARTIWGDSYNQY